MILLRSFVLFVACVVSACNFPVHFIEDGGADSGTPVPPRDFDIDDDGVRNSEDNCIDVANDDQLDRDLDNVGDACDNCAEVANSDQNEAPCTSEDGDETPDSYDNCVGVANDSQLDTDSDGRGDACDTCDTVANVDDDAGIACNDRDSDAVLDHVDNCPAITNNGQIDVDGDGVGDACDNCAPLANEDQADFDTDGFGDACNGSDDDDGIADELDNCLGVHNPSQEDRDADGVGNACDNCPDFANQSQADDNIDGIGNACENFFVPVVDVDGDGANDVDDNCPTANASQADSDSDGRGDACDNCTATANFDQADANGDGEGDACEASIDGEPFCADGKTTVHTEEVPSNVFFLIDRSGSMTDAWEQVRGALTKIAPNITEHNNTGLAVYPNAAGCALGPDHRLAMGAHSADALVNSVAWDIAPSGFTPTAAALEAIRQSGWAGASGSRAVVLLTDGVPMPCEGGLSLRIRMAAVEAQAAMLAEEGIKLFVIGLRIDPNDTTFRTHLQNVAEIGDPSNPNAVWYGADNASDLESAFTTIQQLVAACNFALEVVGEPNYERSRLVLDASGATTQLFDYVRDGSSIELGATSCSLLRSALATDPQAEIRFEAACEDPEMCFVAPGTAEICRNGLDDNCNGFADESCDGDVPEICGDGMGTDADCPTTMDCEPRSEVCDSTDNDCDGYEDEGCPTPGTMLCVGTPELCNGLDDDCDGIVDDGCGCSPRPEICGDRVDNDCDDAIDENCNVRVI